MENEQDKFDELFRQKFAEKEFVFNEENWEKMEKKLDSSRRFRRIGWWTSIFICGIIGGIILTYLFLGKENTTDINTSIVASHSKEIVDTRIVTNKENTNDEKIEVIKGEETVSTSNSNQEENKVAVSEEKIEKENATELKNSSEETTAQKTERVALIATTSVSKSSLAKENIAKEKNSASTASLKKVKTNKNDVASTNESKANLKVSTKSLSDKKVAKETEMAANVASQKTTKTNSEGKSEKKNNVVASLNDVVQKDKTVDLTQNNATTSATKTEVSSTETASKASETIAKEVSKQNEALPLINGTEINSSAQPQTKNLDAATTAVLKNNLEVTTTKKDETISPTAQPEAIKKSDSTTTAAPTKVITPAPAPPVQGLASITTFSVDAGTNFEMGWKYTDVTEGQGFNPVLGVGITHYLNQKWAIHSGLHYGSIAYLKASEKTFSSTTYSFGSTTVDKVIDSKFLHYAVLPLMVEYHFNDKNSVRLGGSISYLINSKSKFTTNTTTVSPMVLDSNQTATIPFETTTSTSTETGYYLNAFSKRDASLAIGYRRNISQKLSLAAIANFGLVDVKNDEFFSQQKFERNIGLQLIISYNLFDF